MSRDGECLQRWNECEQNSVIYSSGVRSPDLFVDDIVIEDLLPKLEISEYHEKYDNRILAKIKETLCGVLPPPSVTCTDLNASDMLDKYKSNIHLFEEKNLEDSNNSSSYSKVYNHGCDISIGGESNNENVFQWPEVLKGAFYDVHYNITAHAEQVEMLSVKCAERYISSETDCTVSVNSTNKLLQRKNLVANRTAQTKSPGRRLSHLAKRRHTFNSVNIFGTSGPKMVQLDKNYFPHRKLAAIRKSPRIKIDKERRTPKRKSSAKKKTPRSGSTKKKAVRRLLVDEPAIPSSSAESQAQQVNPLTDRINDRTLKLKRVLFNSPANKNDLNQSLELGKRKRDPMDNTGGVSKCRTVRSLSFGGDNMECRTINKPVFARCSTETLSHTHHNPVKFTDLQKKKMLWAVSEALRGHGLKLGVDGFKERATLLVQLLKKLLLLPVYITRMKTHSTSDTMLRLARKYAFSIINGESIDDCYRDELDKLSANTAKFIVHNIREETKENSSIAVNSSKAVTVKEASILKACRQISFDSG